MVVVADGVTEAVDVTVTETEVVVGLSVVVVDVVMVWVCSTVVVCVGGAADVAALVSLELVEVVDVGAKATAVDDVVWVACAPLAPLAIFVLPVLA